MRNLKPAMLAMLLTAAAVAVAATGSFAAARADEASAADLQRVLHPATGLMTFGASTVVPAKGVAQDLYEPSIMVSGTGAIYVAGHVIGAYSTGTPGYVSTNNGATWTQLPTVANVNLNPVSSSGQPGGDEGIIVADGTGKAWLVDMGAQGMSVTGYCGNGATVCYNAPAVWNAQQSALSSCGVASLGTDRPWAAWSNNRLLLVNNGYLGTAGNRVQFSILNTAAAAPVTPPSWNMCASAAGFIPGVPAIRPDGRFVIPQVQGTNMKVLSGTGLTGVTATTAFTVASTDLACGGADSGFASNYGYAAASKANTFYIAGAKDATHITVAATTTGTTFRTATFASNGGAIAFLWISGSQLGEGALLSWAETSNCGFVTLYAAHVTLDATGTPTLSDVTGIATVNACGDLMGSSLGPTGNAYVVAFSDVHKCTDTPLATPLRVYLQTAGPTL